MAAKPPWRTVTVDGKKITYAVMRKNGQRVVLIKKKG